MDVALILLPSNPKDRTLWVGPRKIKVFLTGAGCSAKSKNPGYRETDQVPRQCHVLLGDQRWERGLTTAGGYSLCWSVFQIPKAKELQAKRPLHASAASLEERQGKSSEGLRVRRDSTWEWSRVAQWCLASPSPERLPASPETLLDYISHFCWGYNQLQYLCSLQQRLENFLREGLDSQCFGLCGT